MVDILVGLQQLPDNKKHQVQSPVQIYCETRCKSAEKRDANLLLLRNAAHDVSAKCGTNLKRLVRKIPTARLRPSRYYTQHHRAHRGPAASTDMRV
eukprot:321533-Rhodomonas_salina.2